MNLRSFQRSLNFVTERETIGAACLPDIRFKLLFNNIHCLFKLFIVSIGRHYAGHQFSAGCILPEIQNDAGMYSDSVNANIRLNVLQNIPNRNLSQVNGTFQDVATKLRSHNIVFRRLLHHLLTDSLYIRILQIVNSNLHQMGNSHSENVLSILSADFTNFLIHHFHLLQKNAYTHRIHGYTARIFLRRFPLKSFRQIPIEDICNDRFLW